MQATATPPKNPDAKAPLTFQQIQKYEKGSNRIGASRLYHIAHAFDVPIQFFFDEAQGIAGPPTTDGLADAGNENFIYDFISTREGVELIRSFVSIKDLKVRKRMVDLVRTIATEGLAGQRDGMDAAGQIH